jgi:tetratricopeptide (TPR) repeat protein
MSELNKDKILEKRFDNDSSEGFDFVHGADDFFNLIKSPFKVVPKAGTLSPFGLLSLEIVIVITMLLTAKLIDLSTDSSEFSFNSTSISPKAKPEILPEEKFIVNEPKLNESTLTHKIVKQNPIQPSSFSSAIASDSSTTLFALNANGLIEKVDSVVKTEVKLLYVYPDVKQYYELRYMQDLLVIDYSDTLFTGEKLKPLLTGVPALYENKEKAGNNQVKNLQTNTFVKLDDYLELLNRPLQFLVKKKYEKALKGFNELLEKDIEDQNALFYGGLAYFNLAEYSNALVSFEKLKQIKNPLFEEDADWLLVKVYQGLGLSNKAMKLLETIAQSNSFYRDQAIQELKR